MVAKYQLGWNSYNMVIVNFQRLISVCNLVHACIFFTHICDMGVCLHLQICDLILENQ